MSEMRKDPELMAMEQQMHAKAMAMPAMQGQPMPVQPMGMEMAAPAQDNLPILSPRMGMTKERLREAMQTLMRYKNGKNEMDQRLLDNERWWDGRGWITMAESGNPFTAKRPTMWLFNVVLGKHADMLESYPEPAILPREKDDEKTARILSKVVPVVLEENDFYSTYDDQAWEKNKNGTAIYAVPWDADKHNGLGDVKVSQVDPLMIYWEPGIDDIQDSRNVFVLQWADKDQLKAMYPQLEGETLESGFMQQNYETEDSSGKQRSRYALVIDWYYKTWQGKKKTLHFCKFVGDHVLYATENMGDQGLYDDGEYPFVVDSLFPIKGSIAGRGYIDIGKGTQESIDLMDHSMVLNAMAGAVPRYFSPEDSGINEKEFLDFTKPIVHVAGGISDQRIRQIEPTQLNGIHVTMLQNKIEELKQVTGNQDVSNGRAGGVTAASAIAALQDSAGRSSKAGIRGTWAAYAKIVKMVISRMRQFYTVDRTFRIVGDQAAMEYMTIGASQLGPQKIEDPINPGEFMGVRIPEFDVSVHAQKENAYSKMAQNELAFQLLNAGIFNPQLADQSIGVLEMMDFPKREELMQRVAKNGRLVKEMAMWQQMALQLASKYEPETARMMASNITGAPMVQGTARPGEAKMPEETQESEVTAKARQRAEESRQPA